MSVADREDVRLLQVSTRASVGLSGEEGLRLLGGSMSARRLDVFKVAGTRWTFGNVALSQLDVTDLRHQPALGESLRFPTPGTVSVFFVVAGQMHVHTPEGQFWFGAGTAAVLPRGELPEFDCQDTARVLFVTFPENSLDGFADLLPSQNAPIAASAVRTTPALSFLLALIETVGTYSIRAEPTASIVVKLIGGLLAADRSSVSPPNRSSIVQIEGEISKNRTDHNFDTKALAQSIHLSTRQTNKIVEESFGERAAELIDEYRAVSAIDVIRKAPGQPLASVAQRSGFRTVQELESVVERIYGLSVFALIDSQQHVGDAPTPDDNGPQQRLPAHRWVTED
ncbi:hypothetical protein B7R21_19375 [Subtercola boreus]|uniref:HTH araC/xylS-type domain-containing protein n=1 Tax=Subtercola boreus TaxID=120213 RepID=A0A3E0VAP7_9MICO|nr:AraC family transcriptional regulator [Subtercola boreus]RFA06603.1 hypothetical protein B7R21_19375 [Subtercola boreus]